MGKSNPALLRERSIRRFDVFDLLQTDWWSNETFSIGEVVKSISAPAPWLRRRRVSITGPGPHPEADAAVREVSTGYGRCYSIYFEAEMAPRHDYYEIILDMSERKSGMLVRQFSAYEKSFAKKNSSVRSVWVLLGLLPRGVGRDRSPLELLAGAPGAGQPGRGRQVRADRKEELLHAAQAQRHGEYRMRMTLRK